MQYIFLLFVLYAVWEAEIKHLYVLFLIKENVFELDVNVGNEFGVAVLESDKYLLEDSPCLLLILLFFYHLLQVSIKTASSNIFISLNTHECRLPENDKYKGSSPASLNSSWSSIVKIWTQEQVIMKHGFSFLAKTYQLQNYRFYLLLCKQQPVKSE